MISDEVQVLKERIAWLEANNANLCRELHEYRSRCSPVDQYEIDSQEDGSCFPKTDRPKRGVENMDTSDYPMNETITGDSSKEIDEEVAKEWEHTLLQNTMDKELNELNKRLEEKESEMKLFGGFDTVALKQHFGKKITELEDEKRTVKQERDRLLAEVESLAATSDGHTQKMQDVHSHKLKALEAQISDLKKKQESQVQLLKQKQRSDEAAKRLQDEIQSIKAQKVQLQHRIKQEAEQFRHWKASREKELLQLRKEGRRNEYERHKLQSLNQRQKLGLVEEAKLDSFNLPYYNPNGTELNHANEEDSFKLEQLESFDVDWDCIQETNQKEAALVTYTTQREHFLNQIGSVEWKFLINKCLRRPLLQLLFIAIRIHYRYYTEGALFKSNSIQVILVGHSAGGLSVTDAIHKLGIHDKPVTKNLI